MTKGMMKREMDGMGRIGAETAVVEFTPPDSIELEGDTGRAMVDWERTPEGGIRIVAFDGVSLSPTAKPEVEEVEESEMEMGEKEEMS